MHQGRHSHQPAAPRCAAHNLCYICLQSSLPRPGKVQISTPDMINAPALDGQVVLFLGLRQECWLSTSHPLHFLPAERSAQAAEAARQTAGGVMGAVREATLNTAQQTREMFDVLQQKALDTVVRVLHMGQEKVHQVGHCAAGGGSVEAAA